MKLVAGIQKLVVRQQKSIQKLVLSIQKLVVREKKSFVFYWYTDCYNTFLKS